MRDIAAALGIELLEEEDAPLADGQGSGSPLLDAMEQAMLNQVSGDPALALITDDAPKGSRQRTAIVKVAIRAGDELTLPFRDALLNHYSPYQWLHARHERCCPVPKP
jgi:hypothetical protein